MADYENPDTSSEGATYREGNQITEGQSINLIRKYNIDNLEKEYNYYYPRCLDLYKKWKYAELNNNSQKTTLEGKYNQCAYKLENLKNKLDEANLVTSEEIEALKKKTLQEDKNIFINQKKIDDSSNILKEKKEIIDTSQIKIKDYNQLYNSITTKNIIWLVLLIIFIIGSLGLGYLYFFSKSEGK